MLCSAKGEDEKSTSIDLKVPWHKLCLVDGNGKRFYISKWLGFYKLVLSRAPSPQCQLLVINCRQPLQSSELAAGPGVDLQSSGSRARTVLSLPAMGIWEQTSLKGHPCFGALSDPSVTVGWGSLARGAASQGSRMFSLSCWLRALPLLLSRACICWGLSCLTFAVINVGAALKWKGKPPKMELGAEFGLWASSSEFSYLR